MHGSNRAGDYGQSPHHSATRLIPPIGPSLRAAPRRERGLDLIGRTLWHYRVAVKVLLALLLIPLKIGIWALKFLLFLPVGIPLLVIGCVIVGATLPFLVIGGLVPAILIAPFVLLVKAISCWRIELEPVSAKSRWSA